MNVLRFFMGATTLTLLIGCQRELNLPEAGEAAGQTEVQEAAAAVEWEHDFFGARQAARKENRPLLLKFTGSDWSPPCADWHNQILDTPEFAEHAKNHLVLVELDFPQDKRQPVSVVQQNQSLQSVFEVEEFPTFILLDPTGEEIRRLSKVLPERPSHFIAWLRHGRIDPS